ncbi:hypothetical protein PF005_g21848 [Phytophthora fragariae]|uniref:Uncharacterized protein n=1 Tax=Phytophthora fragariae TaxID=53985 RepID=A0A6A3WIB8_9STRA|nr:hypothetical protein PF009_g26629 [Phytophthora fragariae]KAE9089682.1 hypothetical protein PF006_g25304 [Phytophthora fragariae]KAE9184024.1 hypothetical protein PF005_g21848 [Phytophthora fragariae]
MARDIAVDLREEAIAAADIDSEDEEAGKLKIASPPGDENSAAVAEHAGHGPGHEAAQDRPDSKSPPAQQVRRSQSVGRPHDIRDEQPREAGKVSPATPSPVGRGREADELRTPTPTTTEADPAVRTGLSPLTQHLSRMLTSVRETGAISSASKPVATTRKAASDEQTTKGMLPVMRVQDNMPTLSLQASNKTAYPTVVVNAVSEQQKAPLQTSGRRRE